MHGRRQIGSILLENLHQQFFREVPFLALFRPDSYTHTARRAPLYKTIVILLPSVEKFYPTPSPHANFSHVRNGHKDTVYYDELTEHIRRNHRVSLLRQWLKKGGDYEVMFGNRFNIFNWTNFSKLKNTAC
jgi:hypothetical protein